MSERFHVERILCPTDFSAYSALALRYAVSLGRWFDAEVAVLHVLPFRGSEFPYFPALASPDSKVRQQAEDQLAQFVEPVLHEPVTIEPKLREGEPWREIVAEATALPADLIVTGTHGRSGFEHLLLGSVAEKVLRRADCPVLTVGQGPRPMAKRHCFRRIVCGVDFTEDSTRTVRFALSLAEEDEAHVTLLHVLEGLPEASILGRTDLPVPGGGPLRRDLEAMALQWLRQAVLDEPRNFSEVKERVAVGKAYHEILRVAAEEQADLIVLGAHARGPLGGRSFGSTSSHVVREASCPVLTFRAPRQAGTARRKDLSSSGAVRHLTRLPPDHERPEAKSLVGEGANRRKVPRSRCHQEEIADENVTDPLAKASELRGQDVRSLQCYLSRDAARSRKAQAVPPATGHRAKSRDEADR
jgi:nucleotide-binding universal stress UspA family protein